MNIFIFVKNLIRSSFLGDKETSDNVSETKKNKEEKKSTDEKMVESKLSVTNKSAAENSETAEKENETIDQAKEKEANPEIKDKEVKALNKEDGKKTGEVKGTGNASDMNKGTEEVKSENPQESNEKDVKRKKPSYIKESSSGQNDENNQSEKTKDKADDQPDKIDEMKTRKIENGQRTAKGGKVEEGLPAKATEPTPGATVPVKATGSSQEDDMDEEEVAAATSQHAETTSTNANDQWNLFSPEENNSTTNTSVEENETRDMNTKNSNESTSEGSPKKEDAKEVEIPKKNKEVKELPKTNNEAKDEGENKGNAVTVNGGEQKEKLSGKVVKDDKSAEKDTKDDKPKGGKDEISFYFKLFCEHRCEREKLVLLYNIVCYLLGLL